MSTATERIRRLVTTLPSKDIPLAYKFLKVRDFDCLKELVDSALFVIRKRKKEDRMTKEDLTIDLDTLNRLKSEVDAYVLQLNIWQGEEEIEDYE